MSPDLDQRPRWLNERLGDADGHGVRVAVVDSGYDKSPRPANVLPGLGWDGPDLPPTRDDRDRLGHGTAVCEAILALAPAAELIPLRVFGDRLETSPGTVVSAIDRALGLGVGVVSLSLGSTSESAEAPFREVCDRARRAGAVVVSAVPLGAKRVFPGSFDGVLGVSPARFGNAHDLDLLPKGTADFAAHGGRTVEWKGEPQELFGSSVAAPHLSALVALVRQRFPKADPDGVRTLLGELAAASRAARHL